MKHISFFKLKNLFTACFCMASLLCAFGQGEVEWQNTIGGANQDNISVIRQTNDGGYIMGGSSSSNISGDKTENCQGGYDYWVLKLDAAGGILWQNTIGGSNNEGIRTLQQTSERIHLGWVFYIQYFRRQDRK